MRSPNINDALDQYFLAALRVDRGQVKGHQHDDGEPEDEDVGHLPVLWVPILSLFWCRGSFDLQLRRLLKVKELDNLLHVADFVGEKLDDGLVAAHFAEMA